MTLSEHFAADQIIRDGTFVHLDEVSTTRPDALVFAATTRYLQAARENPNVACIVTHPSLASQVIGRGLVISDDPRLDFFKLYNVLHARDTVGPFCDFAVGSDCTIDRAAVVSEKTRLGDRVVIGPGAIIADYTIIGDDAYVGAGVVVGAEGLLTLRDGRRSIRVRHAGHVVVGNNVNILSGAVIAKSLYSAPTRIGDDTQIGVLASIGHGVRIGARCTISGNCVVAGRVVIEDDVWLGASCTIAQGLRIGEGAKAYVGSVVIQDVAAGECVSGNFAVRHSLRLRGHLRQLQ